MASAQSSQQPESSVAPASSGALEPPTSLESAVGQINVLTTRLNEVLIENASLKKNLNACEKKLEESIFARRNLALELGECRLTLKTREAIIVGLNDRLAESQSISVPKVAAGLGDAAAPATGGLGRPPLGTANLSDPANGRVEVPADSSSLKIDADNIHPEALQVLPPGAGKGAPSGSWTSIGEVNEETTQTTLKLVEQFILPANPSSFTFVSSDENGKEVSETRRLLTSDLYFLSQSIQDLTSKLPEHSKLKVSFIRSHCLPAIVGSQRCFVSEMHHLNTLFDAQSDGNSNPRLAAAIDCAWAGIKLFYGAVFGIIRFLLVEFIAYQHHQTSFSETWHLAEVAQQVSAVPEVDPRALLNPETIKSIARAHRDQQTFDAMTLNQRGGRSGRHNYRSSLFMSGRDKPTYRGGSKRDRRESSDAYDSRREDDDYDHDQDERKDSYSGRGRNAFRGGRGNARGRSSRFFPGGQSFNSNKRARGGENANFDKHWYAQTDQYFETHISDSSLSRVGWSFESVCAEMARFTDPGLGDFDSGTWSFMALDDLARASSGSTTVSQPADRGTMDGGPNGGINKLLDKSMRSSFSHTTVRTMDFDYISSEEERPTENSHCDQPSSSQSIHEFNPFQDGKSSCSTHDNPSKLMVCENRHKRCFSSCPDSRAFSEVPTVPMDGVDVRVPGIAIRSESLTSYLHESDEASSLLPQISRNSLPVLYRRHPDLSEDPSTSHRTRSDYVINTNDIGFYYQLGEIGTDTDADDRVLRCDDRHTHDDVSGPSTQSCTFPPHGGPNSSESTSGTFVSSERDSESAGQAQCNSRYVLDAAQTYLGSDARQEQSGRSSRVDGPCSPLRGGAERPFMVGIVHTNQLTGPGTDSRSQPDDRTHVRRFQPGLGRILDGTGGPASSTRFLETGGANPAQQHTGDTINNILGKSFRSPLERHPLEGLDDSRPQRQYDRGVLYDEDGWSYGLPDTSDPRTTGLVRITRDSAHSSTHSRPRELESRSPFALVSGQVRLETRLDGIQQAEQIVGGTERVLDRPLRDPREHSTSPVRQLVLRSGSDVGGRVSPQLVGGEPIRKPTVLIDSTSINEGSPGTIVHSADLPGLANPTLVARTSGANDGTSPSSLPEQQPAVSRTPPIDRTTKLVGVRVEDLRILGSRAGLDADTVDHIIRSWRTNTNKRYDAAWRHWIEFCDSHHCDAEYPNTAMLANFLTSRAEAGVRGATVNVEASAINSFYKALNWSSLIEEGNAAARVKRTARVEQPSVKTNAEQYWDPRVVLDHIEQWPSPLCLKGLRAKLVFLLRVKTMCRSSDVAGVLRSDGIRWVDDQSLKIRFFRPKESQTNNFSEWIEIKKSDRPTICLFSTLKEYLARTESLKKCESISYTTHSTQRTDTGLILALKPGKNGVFTHVSADTVANITKQVMREAGIDTSVFKAHSVRGAVSSLARSKGMDVDAICRLARWKSQRTFDTHYWREFPHVLRAEIQPQSLDEALLSEAKTSTQTTLDMSTSLADSHDDAVTIQPLSSTTNTAEPPVASAVPVGEFVLTADQGTITSDGRAQS